MAHTQNTFNFTPLNEAPDRGRQHETHYGGGLVKMGEVVLGGWHNRVYSLTENQQWVRNPMWEYDDGARLAVYRGELLSIGGWKNGWSRKVKRLDGGEWPDMPEECSFSCVVSVDDVLIVIGGRTDRYIDGNRLKGDVLLKEVMVFNGRRWHKGPQLPTECECMSAAVYRGCIVVMGGVGMGKRVWCARIRDLIRRTAVHSKRTPQSVWSELPEVPYYYSSVCVVDGVLLAIGGTDLTFRGTFWIYAFDRLHSRWKRVGKLPFNGYSVDTLPLAGRELMVVDYNTKQVWNGTMQ